MEEILQLIGQYGAMGMVFALFIYLYFRDKDRADKLRLGDKGRKTDTDEVARKVNDEQQERITVMETLLGEHCKTQEAAFSAVHNGLNANANAVQNVAHEIGDMKVMLERVKTIIEERFK